MPKINRPRRGSLAFRPEKACKEPDPEIPIVASSVREHRSCRDLPGIR